MRLPKLRELTDTQKDVYLYAPTDKHVLVSGPPGTGKTLIAGLRATELRRQGVPVVLGMFNQVLARYTSNVGAETQDSSVTLSLWFIKWWQESGFLSEHFRGVAAKTLSAVEADPGTSNQHEFNGVSRLKSILGLDRRTIPARFVYLSEAEVAPTTAEGFLTWYDARERDPRRSEHRLYFPTTTVSTKFHAGDLFVMALRNDKSAMCIVAEGGSTAANQIRWLFGLDQDALPDFVVTDEGAADTVRLEYASRLILQMIGIEPEPQVNQLLDIVLGRFGGGFPSTKEFSAFVRESTALDARDDPDKVLMAWMDLEEAAFRVLERHLIAERLTTGFGGTDGVVDVDGFVTFSLGVQNRRKSRAGYALENHLGAMFEEYSLRHARTPMTENRSRPDFLFPGVTEYRDPAYPTAQLTMLAAKTSAKDRWRQILGEADRIPVKHLITLEPGISTNQTDEMKVRSVALVLPKSIHSSYLPAQRNQLMDVETFIAMCAERQ